jgi:DMSO/TMAO reductase YedYZ molybdopterin-dependent catalytic subunit
MKHHPVSRRSVLKGGGAALAGLSVLRVGVPEHAFGGQSGRSDVIAADEAQAVSAQAFPNTGGEVIPWLDQPAPNPIPGGVGNLLEWEAIDSFLTPANDFFFVQHYGQPSGLDEATWRVDVGGLVARPS